MDRDKEHLYDFRSLIYKVNDEIISLRNMIDLCLRDNIEKRKTELLSIQQSLSIAEKHMDIAESKIDNLLESSEGD